MPEKEPIVQARSLRKTFIHGDAEVVALDNVDLDVEEGDFLSLMGPSGSGKSTLLYILAGIDRASGGECHVLGQDINTLTEDELSAWRSEHIGFVFQSFNLIPVLTAFENVEMPLLLTSLSRREREEHVRTALEIVGLGDRMTHYPRQLSGGQEQRVAIARALIADPDMILADEPTGDLDAHAAEDVLNILRTLNNDFGKTIIMVTHDPKASTHAKTVRHLDKGLMLP
jgi:putative ABC transport system ATP-binding protein